MAYVFSILYLLVFCVSGFVISAMLLKAEKALVRTVFGLSFGLALLMWLPALFAFVLDFTRLALYLAFAAAVAILSAGFVLWKKNPSTFNFNLSDLLSEDAVLILITPLFLFTLILLNTHILPINAQGALQSGQSTFGDMPMHMSFISSISVQKAFPPNYNFIGKPVLLGYPFLCDSVSSVFFTFTSNMRFSYMMPMIPALLTVYLSVYMLFELILKDKKATICATLVFLIGGGFGFAYFMDMTRANVYNFLRIFEAFYTTPTNYVDKNIIWVNPIADMLIPQRSTLFGWLLLFPGLFLLYRAAFEGEKKYFVALGGIAGALPLIHTHSFLVLGILSSVFVIRAFLHVPNDAKLMPELKMWLVYAGIAVLLSSMQLYVFTFQQVSGGNFLRYNFNWVNKKDSYLWFYIKNFGLLYILVIPAFLNADRNLKWFYAGGIVLLVIAEFFAFQPNNYDNNKIIFIWYLFSCGIVSKYVCDIYRRLKGMPGIKFIAAVVIITANLSGILTLAREAVSHYDVFSKPHREAAQFICGNIEPDALFLTSNNHNNAVASLTGRNIFVGSGSYLFFHGIDIWEMERIQRQMFEAPTVELLELQNIDYVYIGDYEKNGFQLDTQFFQDNCKQVYDNEVVTIYQVPKK